MKTVPFSSDSAFDTVAYTLVKKQIVGVASRSGRNLEGARTRFRRFVFCAYPQFCLPSPSIKKKLKTKNSPRRFRKQAIPCPL